MLAPNIFELEYEDYKIDYVKFNDILTHLTEFQDISYKNSLPFVLGGHLNLILLSSKIYRTPEDIDLLINIHDFDKWLNCLKPSWDWYGDLKYIDYLFMFLEKKLQIYGSNKINTCVNNEFESTTYEINNKFLIYKESNHYNPATISTEINLYTPEWAVHNPIGKDENGVSHVEIKNDLFKIIFSTNPLGQHFRSFIIFYNKNFEYKKIVECSFDFDRDFNNQKYAYWSTPFLKLEEYNNSFYKIFVHKNLYSTRLINKKTNIIADFYISDNDTSYYNKTKIEYVTPIQENVYIKSKFNNKPINLTNPYYSLIHKYERKKDIDDHTIYKYLLDQYPVVDI